jgi:hypothetical protein
LARPRHGAQATAESYVVSETGDYYRPHQEQEDEEYEMLVIMRPDLRYGIPGDGQEDSIRGRPMGRKLTEAFASVEDDLRAQGPAEQAEHDIAELRVLLNELEGIGRQVYRGVSDDPRNTDNAWSCTTCTHYHCSPRLAQLLDALSEDRSGASTGEVFWLLMDPIEELRYIDLYGQHREWAELVLEHRCPHVEAGTHHTYLAERVPLHDGHVAWDMELPDYQPPLRKLPFAPTTPAAPSDDKVYSKPDAVVHSGPDESVLAAFTRSDNALLRWRSSYEKTLALDAATNAPKNPRGRTGVCGPGELFRWGPNHAFDMIVTRDNPLNIAQLEVRRQRGRTRELCRRGSLPRPIQAPPLGHADRRTFAAWSDSCF